MGELKEVNMRNDDFWMWMSEIMNEGFRCEGVGKLDDYGEELSSGKMLYKGF